jgi:hypothetical protein
MPNQNAVRLGRAQRGDLDLTPAVAHLRNAVPEERRNRAAREALQNRVRAEFHQMPGMCLTALQAAKLFGLSPDVTLRILQEFVRADVLLRTPAGRFTQRTTHFL